MSPGKRVAVLLALGFAAGCSGGGGTSSSTPSTPEQTVLSAPACAGVANIIAEDAHAPPNVTVIRVQHIGDPGTPEWLGEVANPVTWDVGALTGLRVPPAAQRGYLDLAPPVASSAFQLQCDAAGFAINTWTFSHAVPLIGEGPSASVSRDLSPAPAPFRDAASTLILEARVAVPWSLNEAPPLEAGTAQVSLFYYAQDRVSGTTIAHVIGLWENRAAGAGAGIETLGNDSVVAFAASPLAPFTASGAPVRFVGVPAGAPQMRFVQPFPEAALFRAEISHARFRDMLLALKAGGSPALSTDPLDYRITLFGVLGEVFPGTGSGHNVALGASVSDLALKQSN